MAGETANGRAGRTIYMAGESWAMLKGLNPSGVARQNSDSATLEAIVLEYPKLRAAWDERVAEQSRVAAEKRSVRQAASRVRDASRTVAKAFEEVQRLLADMEKLAQE